MQLKYALWNLLREGICDVVRAIDIYDPIGVRHSQSCACAAAPIQQTPMLPPGIGPHGFVEQPSYKLGGSLAQAERATPS